MSNIHDAKELAYRLIRHARSKAGHTPLVHLDLSDANLLEELLTSLSAAESRATRLEVAVRKSSAALRHIDPKGVTPSLARMVSVAKTECHFALAPPEDKS